MWVSTGLYPFPRPQRPPDPGGLLGIAWLRVAAAREAYGYGDLEGTQHHVEMAQEAAAQALAIHRGLPHEELEDPVNSATFCCEQVGPPMEELIMRIASLGHVRLADESLSENQQETLRKGLSASSEMVALVEELLGS